MNDLKELIKEAKELQQITDKAVKETLNVLRAEFKGKYYEQIEETVLIYIYDGTDINDNEITLNNLMKKIRAINKG